MPKVPRGEWEETLDPRSEEHSPTKDQLEEDSSMLTSVAFELGDIEDELANPMEDRYTGEKDKFRAIDPEVLRERLTNLREDIKKVSDPELREKMKDRITKIEKRVYQQFVPFIDSMINRFGFEHSPLESHAPKKKLDFDEIVSEFKRAHAFFKNFKLSDDDEADILIDFDCLVGKLDRYQREPVLFTFEKIEEDLQEELVEYKIDDVIGDYVGKNNKKMRRLDSEDAQKQNAVKFEALLDKVQLLRDITKQMTDHDIKISCEARAEVLLDTAEYLKIKNEAPRELLAVEVELKSLLYRLKNGEKIDENQVEEISKRIAATRKKNIGGEFDKIVGNINKLFLKIQKIISGETIDEDDDRFNVEFGDVDWAWLLLGVKRNASKEEVRRVYHQLAKKYHPDYNKKEDAKEKMEKINEAFGLVQRVMGYK